MEKTTRPFRYDLNQIPDNYIVEATSINRIKGLGLVEKASEELWTNVCNIAEEALTLNHPKEIEMLEGKVVV